MWSRAAHEGGLPLPCGERVGVRGFRTQFACNPSPGSLRDPTSPYGRGESACGTSIRLTSAVSALTLSILLFSVPAHAQLRGHGGPVRAVAVSADGREAVSGSFDTSAIRWSLERN